MDRGYRKSHLKLVPNFVQHLPLALLPPPTPDLFKINSRIQFGGSHCTVFVKK